MMHATSDDALVQRALHRLRSNPDSGRAYSALGSALSMEGTPRQLAESAVNRARDLLRREITVRDTAGVTEYAYTFPEVLRLVVSWYEEAADPGLRRAWTSAASGLDVPDDATGLQYYADRLAQRAALALGHDDFHDEDGRHETAADRAGLRLHVTVGRAYNEPTS